MWGSFVGILIEGLYYEVPTYSTATRFSLSSDTIDRSA